MNDAMALQVHAVMQDAQDIDLVLCAIDPKNHKMPTGASIASHMQRVNITGQNRRRLPGLCEPATVWFSHLAQDLRHWSINWGA